MKKEYSKVKGRKFMLKSSFKTKIFFSFDHKIKIICRYKKNKNVKDQTLVDLLKSQLLQYSNFFFIFKELSPKLTN